MYEVHSIAFFIDFTEGNPPRYPHVKFYYYDFYNSNEFFIGAARPGEG